MNEPTLNDLVAVLRAEADDVPDAVPFLAHTAPSSPTAFGELSRRRRRRSWAAAVSVAVVLCVLAAVVLAVVRAGARRADPAPRHVPSAQSVPRESPLAACADPLPRFGSVAGPVAAKFARQRVRSTVTFDSGLLRIAPPPAGTVPPVPAALAYCNLLAGHDPSGASLADDAYELGASFGLGVVTIAHSVLRDGPHDVYPSISKGPRVELTAYDHRLAWVLVINNNGWLVRCGLARGGRPETDPVDRGYQVVAIDARTGASGILYSTGYPAPCGGPKRIAVRIAPAVITVSVPWTLVRRGPSARTATLDHPLRSCGGVPDEASSAVGEAAVGGDRAHPGLVSVQVIRVLAGCSTTMAHASLELYSNNVHTALPATLTHARVGAVDIADVR